MHIQYYGLSCLKITVKPQGRGGDDVVVLVNPFAKSADLRPPQAAGAQVILSSLPGDDYGAVSPKAEGLLIDMPGEYAAFGIQIIGLPVPDAEGAEKVTAFVLETEGIRTAVLSGLGREPAAKTFDELVDVDVLFLPVGGGDVLSPSAAGELARKIEPAFVLPLHYRLPGKKRTAAYAKVDEFCAVMGGCPKERPAKITIKEKDCRDRSNEIIVLSP